MLVSRLKVDHPALDTPGGPSLHTAIETIYSQVGNNIGSRYYEIPSLLPSASSSVEHNFATSFSNIRFQLYDWTGGLLTLLTPDTVPSINDYTIIPTVGSTEHWVTITNNGSGSGGLVLTLEHDPILLGAIQDVDMTGVQDGQVPVYNLSQKKYMAGASGDASFKVQTISSNIAFVKGGFLYLDDGRELATYNSSASTYGTDIQINLDTILGSSPSAATTYYLFVDNSSLGLPTLESGTGRRLYGVSEPNFYLSTIVPESQLLSRYVPIDLITTATSAGTWDGVGSTFRNLAVRRHSTTSAAALPLMYDMDLTTVGYVGSVGQIAAGHFIDEHTFRQALRSTSLLSIYPLSSSTNDSYGGRNLTAVGAPLYTGTNIFGSFNSTIVLDGGTQYLYNNTSSVFNPGPSDFSFGLWAGATDWTPAVNYGALISNEVSGTDRGFTLFHHTDGSIVLRIPTSATTYYDLTTPNPGFADGSWHRFDVTYNSVTNEWRMFVDGQFKETYTQAMRTTVGQTLYVGAVNTPTWFFAGSLMGLTFVREWLSDFEVGNLYATKIQHNKNLLAERQSWSFDVNVLGVGPRLELTDVLVDKTNPNFVLVNFAGQNPTDQVSLKLFDTGANNATLVPQVAQEFIFTDPSQLTTTGSNYPTNLPDRVRYIQAFQKDTDGWKKKDDVAGIWVTHDDPRYLRGDISAWAPSPTEPVAIVVATSNVGLAAPIVDTSTAGIMPWANYEKRTIRGTMETVERDSINLVDTTPISPFFYLPTTTSTGTKVVFYDVGTGVFTLRLTTGGSVQIDGSYENREYSIAGGRVELMYTAGLGWRTINSPSIKTPHYTAFPGKAADFYTKLNQSFDTSSIDTTMGTYATNNCWGCAYVSNGYYSAAINGELVVMAPYGSAYVYIYSLTNQLIFTGASHGMGASAFKGAVTYSTGNSQYTLLVPCNSPQIMLVPSAAMSTLVAGPAHGKGASQVFNGGVVLPLNPVKVMLIPTQSSNIGLYNPSTNTYADGPLHGAGTFAFQGGVLMPNGLVLMVPYNSATVGLYNPMSNTYSSGPAHGKGTGAFIGGVLTGNRKVVLIPHYSANIGVYDIDSNSYSDGPAVGGSQAYAGGCLMPDGRVFLTPYSSTVYRAYDPITNMVSTLTSTAAPGSGAYVGATLLSNGDIICPGYAGTNTIRYRTYTPFPINMCQHPCLHTY